MLRRCGQCIFLFVISWSCAAQISESTAPYVGIKVQATGNASPLFEWIDNDNLVVTSNFDDARGATPSKVVIVNSISGKELLIAETAHLLCASTSESIVGVMQSNDARSQPSIVFFKWNGSNGQATKVVPEMHLNYLTCNRVASESDSGTKSAERYLLRLGDGEIVLARPEPDDIYKESMKLLLKKADGNTVPLDADRQDLKQLPTYIEHLRSYLLAPAYAAHPGSYWLVRGRKVFDRPMVMMSRDGAITKIPVPSALRAHLKSDTNGYPAARGQVYIVKGQASSGSGLYLARGEHVEKIWCTSSQLESKIPSFKPSCDPGLEIRISPDGCKAAIFGDAPGGRSAQLRVLNICQHEAK